MNSESAVQTHTRLELARAGALCWRNNVGACVDDTGRMIRYGLGNDSAQLNQAIKSSDLIGCVPVTIRPEHVGRTAGIFAAIECKHPGWHMTPSDQRAQAQQKYIDLVLSVGGMGGIVSDPAQVRALLDRW